MRSEKSKDVKKARTEEKDPSKREESEREKENSREATKMCGFLLFGRLVGFLMLSGLLKSF